MPKNKDNDAISKLIIHQQKAERAMSALNIIPNNSYRKRANYYGNGDGSADWQGNLQMPDGSMFPGTNDKMPGTTPVMPKSGLDKLLELLRIKKKRKDTIPELKHPGFL
jgi:hypothetical protein